MAIQWPGKPGVRRHSENIQAVTTAKQGLTNSDACNENPAIDNQRRAPLISAPNTRVRINRTIQPANPRQAKRRMACGSGNEMASINATATGNSINWRCTK